MKQIETVVSYLQEHNIPHHTGEPMKNHTTFQIGGPAAVFVVPADRAQLKAALACGQENRVPVFYLGQGSNVLFQDAGYAGLVVHLTEALGGVTVQQENVLTAGAGVVLKDLCRAAQKAALTGLEFAYGIPGSVGGAVFMDAGAFGGDMRQVLHSVTYLDEQLREITAPVEDLDLSYRHSVFQETPWCIVSATFRLAPGNAEKIQEKMDEHMRWREEKQPLDLPSAGSAFKRPEGAYAGALIDQSGLRGYRMGDAAISQKHCGFIVNLGNASCDDVLALADSVAATVWEKTGFVLEKEIQVVRDK